MTSQEVKELARRIAQLEGRVRSLSTSPRLARASIDNNFIPEYDENGVIVALIGKQADGTHGVVNYTGPIPPVPDGLTVAGGAAQAEVTWGGTFVDSAPTPLDLLGVEVYVASVDFTGIEDARFVARMLGAEAGSVTIRLQEGDHYVALVAVTNSYRRSAVSAREVVTVTKVTAPDIDPTGLVAEGVYVTETMGDGSIQVRVNLTGTGEQSVGVYGTDGELSAGMDENGKIVGNSVAVQTVDASEDILFRGVPFLDIAGRGPLVKAEFVGSRLLVGTTETALFHANFEWEPKRFYLLSGGIETYPTDSEGEVYIAIRVARNADATLSSTKKLEFRLGKVSSNTWDSRFFNHYITSAVLNEAVSNTLVEGDTCSLLVTGRAGSVGGACFNAEPGYVSHLMVIDVGAAVPTTQNRANVTAPTQQYTRSTSAAWALDYAGHQSYAQYTYNNNLYQGTYAPYGPYKSLIRFPDSVLSDLNGSTVHYIDVFLQNVHSYSSTGLTARIGPAKQGTAATPPTTYSGAVTASTTDVHFAKGEGKWVRLPSSWYSGFKNGATHNSIALVMEGLAGYGYFGTSVPIRYSYTK